MSKNLILLILIVYHSNPICSFATEISENTESVLSLEDLYKINISTTGLISILGGKWTTYRKIAEDAVDASISLGGLRKRNCKTKNLRIHGFRKKVD